MSENKFHLFHSIDTNSADNAAVRKFISDNGLKDQIEFHNTFYEGSLKLMTELTKQTQTPSLAAGGKVFVGVNAIQDFLKNSVRAE